ERELFPVCRDQGLGYTPFSPLAGGLLTGKYRLNGDYPDGSRMTMRPEPYFQFWNVDTFAGLDRLNAEAEQRGVSMAGLALSWVMSSPDVTAPIVGPRKAEHFTPIKEALDLHLSEDERTRIADLFSSKVPQ